MKISGNTERAGRFAFLDGLRGIAAIAVVVGHISREFYGKSFNPNFWLSVPFFFILSAFVLEFAYSRKLRGALTPLAFMVQRVVRLFPLIIVAAAISAAYAAYQVNAGAIPIKTAAVSLASSITTLPVLIGAPDGRRWPLNQPLWSLFWELVASGAFGLIVYRAGTRWLILVAGAALIGIAYLGATGSGLTQPLTGQALLTIFGFAIGPALLLLRKDNRKSGVALGWGAAAVFSAILFVPVSLAPIGNLLTLGLVAPAVVYFGSYVTGVRTNERKLYANLGELSYPLYVLHWPIMLAVSATTEIGQTGKFWVTFTLSIVIAFAASRWVDVPLRNAARTWWLTKWAFRRNSQQS